jgi:hypothetical protein
MFAEPLAPGKALDDALVALAPAKRREALAIFEVARSGLSDDALSSTMLAPALTALCNTLHFDLKPFLTSETIFETRVLEAAAALWWLFGSLPFSEREKKGLERLAARYNVDLADLDVHRALDRAKSEFRRSIAKEFSLVDFLVKVSPHLMGVNK